MPHKRAKQATRVERRDKVGFDRPPKNDDGMSKKMAFALNAEKARAEYKEKKRKGEVQEDEEERPKKRKKEAKGDHQADVAKIKPGESIEAFNHRVELEFRDKMRDAYKTSIKTGPKKPKAGSKARIGEEELKKGSTKAGKTEGSKGKLLEFERHDDRKSVNDVVQEPPTLTKLPRKAPTSRLGDKLPVSGVERRLMEEERERVIARYREMKAAKNGSE